MLIRTFVFLCRFAPIKRLMWRWWYQFLAKHRWQHGWTFMNYGFVPTPPAAAPVLEPEDEPNRHFIQLYHGVAGAADLRGRKVLEVGSGRGGGAAYLKKYLGPASVTGTDISPNAVELCRRTHRVDGLTFMRGDAEALPFEEASFDAVVNVESSHCYGSMERFLAEVRRVLKPGGQFLYADLRDAPVVETWTRQLEQSGMTVLRDVDITENVLAALEAEDARKRELIARLIPTFLQPAFTDFAGLRGSQVYEAFRTRAMVYRMFTLQRPASIASRT